MAGEQPTPLLGSGRDVIAKAKNGTILRVFVMIERVNRPSGKVHDCLFVCRMVHIKSEAACSKSSKV